MKELSIEEKAKRYDEILVKLQEAKVDNNVCDERYCCVIDDIIPELKDSEDERMIQYFKDLAPFDKAEELYEKYGFSHKDAIAWLEKKCEQKSVKVPKFKVGDFIQFNGMGHTRYTVKEVCGLSHYINTCNKRMDMSYTDANFELVEDHAMLAGMNKMEQQMMAKAVDAVVKVDAGGYPYIPQIELYDYGKDIPLAKEGDKYKVILIKED